MALILTLEERIECSGGIHTIADHLHGKKVIGGALIVIERSAGTVSYTHLILSSPTLLREACKSGTPLEGRAVLCDGEHNLHVDLGCMRGIIPKKDVYKRQQYGLLRLASQAVQPSQNIVAYRPWSGRYAPDVYKRQVQEQSILILHFVLGLPDQEVGRLVGMSRSAVQRRRRCV